MHYASEENIVDSVIAAIQASHRDPASVTLEEAKRLTLKSLRNRRIETRHASDRPSRISMPSPLLLASANGEQTSEVGTCC